MSNNVARYSLLFRDDYVTDWRRENVEKRDDKELTAWRK